MVLHIHHDLERLRRSGLVSRSRHDLRDALIVSCGGSFEAAEHNGRASIGGMDSHIKSGEQQQQQQQQQRSQQQQDVCPTSAYRGSQARGSKKAPERESTQTRS